jgi:methylated-DNA-[protein]-cysteine S-methyltransferase
VTRCGFTLFDTAIGRCGIAWGEGGIVCLGLPERHEAALRRRLLRRLPRAEGPREAPPPPEVARARDAIVALLRGEPVDLADVALDMTGVPAFDRRIYALARGIPAGATRSYGEIAAQLGEPEAARGVGRALARNPFPVVVPCHRVLAARGAIGGFSAQGGTATKQRLLAIEAARTAAQPDFFDAPSAGSADGAPPRLSR